MEVASLELHGRRHVHRTAGAGEPVVLVHGITQDARTWEPISGRLAERVRVYAPDLPGHGDSDPPPGDHSIAGYACSVRDLVVALGLGRVTIVGHSLGGGVALQFAYQFPELTGRIVLIDSGGLGPDVSPLLRAAVLPGAGPVLRVLSSRPVTSLARQAGRWVRRLGGHGETDLREARRGIAGLADPGTRQAFLRTVRTSIGLRGQRVSATDRLYLAATVPTLIVWGERDPIIPLRHGREAHAAIAGSRFETIPGCGHFPHLDAPDRTAEVILDFLATTAPAQLAADHVRRALRDGAPTRSGEGTPRPPAR